MKTLLLAASLSTIAAGALAADTAPSPHQLSGTASVVSDYVFRGLTQTWGRPALQAGVDYAHVSGAWASLWASTLSDKVVAGSHAEVDVSFGYRGAIEDRWNYGAGVISVFYPGGNWNRMRWGARPDQTYDFTEANAFVGYKWVTVQYSRALTDLLGFNETTGFDGRTRGASYVEVNAEVPVMGTGFVLGLHAGRQDFRATAGGVDPDFEDYRISLGKTFAGGWTGAVQVTRNTNTAFYNGSKSNLDENDRRDIGKRRVAILVNKAF